MVHPRVAFAILPGINQLKLNETDCYERLDTPDLLPKPTSTPRTPWYPATEDTKPIHYAFVDLASFNWNCTGLLGV